MPDSSDRSDFFAAHEPPRVPIRLSRRAFVGQSALVVAGTAALATVPRVANAEDLAVSSSPSLFSSNLQRSVPLEVIESGTLAPGQPGRDYTPVITPNSVALPWRIVDGAKVFHLIAGPIRHEFAPGLLAECWGYNGRTSGPTIEAVEGDRVRIYVTNRLPEPTTVHWHGIIAPNGMDGVPGLTQPPIAPGQTFKYEFTLRQHGTFMYHPHLDEMTQQAMGLMGMFIIHPRRREGRIADRDFALMTSEWRIDAGTRRPDPNEMVEFNMFTFNSKAFPATEPLVVKQGDLVRVRFGNLSATDHHPIHIHGHAWRLVATDGGPIAEAGQWPETTILVPVGTTRTMEFIADNPGDWAMHCHMTHHVMNQMGHPGVNTNGVDAQAIDNAVQQVLPSYMTMGTAGMGDMSGMGSMNMSSEKPSSSMAGMSVTGAMGAVPRNSIPMLSADGQFGSIDMGGMFTVLKVRPGLRSMADPGWYKHPTGTVASLASASELQRDGIG